MTGKEFVDLVVEGNQPLFKASRLNARGYFESNPSKEDLVTHFIGRMSNERMNMVEISAKVANLPEGTSVEEAEELSRQAYDEAVHFRMVKEIIDRLNDNELDVEGMLKIEEEKPTAKGATLLEKYGAQDNEAALALYQLVAEGRAEAVWDEMSKCIEDEYIASRYSKISEDEGFHSTIGYKKLAKLAESKEVQAYILGLVDTMRKDLYDISCNNTSFNPEGEELVKEAYGW